jgi:hypothetical protein
MRESKYYCPGLFGNDQFAIRNYQRKEVFENNHRRKNKEQTTDCEAAFLVFAP